MLTQAHDGVVPPILTEAYLPLQIEPFLWDKVVHSGQTGSTTGRSTFFNLRFNFGEKKHLIVS